jgi:hypothetical protein
MTSTWLSDLGHVAGLIKMEEEAQAKAKAAGKSEKEIDSIYYSMYGNGSPRADVVRKHLDSGVLVKLIAEKEATLLAMPTKERELEFHPQDPCYPYVLLGACAMTLGCRLPESYTAMLKKVYTGGLMTDALKQMERVLFGPNAYVNGTP